MSAPTAVKAPAKVTPPPVKPTKVTMEVGTLRVVRVGADDVWSIEREFTDDSRQVLHQGIEGQAKALRIAAIVESAWVETFREYGDVSWADEITVARFDGSQGVIIGSVTLPGTDEDPHTEEGYVFVDRNGSLMVWRPSWHLLSLAKEKYTPPIWPAVGTKTEYPKPVPASKPAVPASPGGRPALPAGPSKPNESSVIVGTVMMGSVVVSRREFDKYLEDHKATGITMHDWLEKNWEAKP